MTVDWPQYKELVTFYGNPDSNFDGLPDQRWESNNLVSITPPYKMFWSWSGQPVIRIRCHEKVAPYLEKALENIGKEFNEEQRKKYQLDRCGGAYNFRTMRTSNRLSVHSYGAAIDLAPERNPLRRRYGAFPDMMPKEAVDIFTEQGARWGGMWHIPDAMHFEWAR